MQTTGKYSTLYDAIKDGNIKAVESLLNKGMDVNSQETFRKMPPLHCAMEEQNIEMINLLMSKGAKVDVRDSLGRTALWYASIHGLFKIVDLLLKLGADINVQDNDGFTALMRVPLEDVPRLHNISCAQLAQKLIARGADFKIQNSSGLTALLSYAFSGDIEATKCLVDAGADVNVKTTLDKTALHIAVKENDINMVKALVSMGAHLNAKCDDFGTALHIAVGENNIAMVEYLVDAGIDVNSKLAGLGVTALHLLTMKTTNPDFVKKLISSKNCIIDLKDAKGMTALCYSLTIGALEVADVLINAGADINNRNNNGNTALNLANYPENRKHIKDALKMTKELVARGADVNNINKNGETPLHGAINNNEFEVIKFLVDSGADVNLQSGDGNSPLNFAATRNNKKILKYLISHKGNVNITNEVGLSPLQVAIATKNFEDAEILTDAGADLDNRETSKGLTALHMLALSTTKSEFSLIEKLLSKGAKLNIGDHQGVTALSFALTKGALKVADMLIKAGGDVNSQSNDGYTALHLIGIPKNRNRIENGVKLAKELIARGVDVNMRNKDGQTVLHLALIYGEVEMAKFLVNNTNVDINCPGENDNTALHSAAGLGDVNFFRLLLSRGADINAKNSWDNTPLQIATIHKKSYIIAELLNNDDCDKSNVNDEGKTAADIALDDMNCRSLKEHFTKENFDFHDVTFCKSLMSEALKSPQLQHLVSILGDKKVDFKNLKGLDPIHTKWAVKADHEKSKKVMKKFMQKKKVGNMRTYDDSIDSLMFFNFEFIPDDKLFMMFFAHLTD